MASASQPSDVPPSGGAVAFLIFVQLPLAGMAVGAVLASSDFDRCDRSCVVPALATTVQVGGIVVGGIMLAAGLFGLVTLFQRPSHTRRAIRCIVAAVVIFYIYLAIAALSYLAAGS